MQTQHLHDAGLTVARWIAKPRSLAMLALGGLTAMAAGNALFGQDNPHPATLFAMRDANPATHQLRADEMQLPSGANETGQVTRIVFQGQQSGTAAQPDGAGQVREMPTSIISQRPVQTVESIVQDASLIELQQLLAQLGFYDGSIDGKSGPMTEKAINDYKTSAGLQGISLDTEQLVTSARNNLLVTAAIPTTRPERAPTGQVETIVFRPAPDRNASADAAPVQPAATSGDVRDPAVVMQVQKALQQFAGDHIVADGLYGSQTRDAIAEFQSVFRMNVTGTIDDGLLEKMRAVGLIDS